MESKTVSPMPLLLARYRLRPQRLQQQVAVLEFPWTQSFNEFIGAVLKAEGKRDLDYHKRPPYQLVNMALTALAPPLVHGFEHMKDHPRQMLALADDPAFRPMVDQIMSVVEPWGRQWVQRYFQSFIEGRGRDAFRRFQEQLSTPQGIWKHVDAYSLWTNLRYRSIPSLIAARLAGKRSFIGDQEVTWRLAQNGGHGLLLVCDPPQRSEWEENGEIRSGLFAYVLRFSVQTQAVSSDPWIHLYVSCRRYAEIVEDFNYGRSATVMVGARTPRLNGWPGSSTLVPLSLRGSRANPSWRYNLEGYGLAELLAEIRVDRPLVDPKTILDHLQYFSLFHPGTDDDEYLVVYAEGMTPNHVMETGFSIVERTRVVKTVAELCQEFLEPDTPLQRDTGTRGKHRPVGLLYPDEIDTHSSLSKRLKMSNAQIKADAMQRAMGHRPFHVLVCWEGERTRDGLLISLRQLCGLGEHDSWPEGMHIQLCQIPPGLGDPLDSGILDPAMHFRPRRTPQERQAYKAFKEQWKTQMRRAYQRKVYQWLSWLQMRLSEPGERYFALLELRTLSRGTHPDQSIHGAIRAACCRLGVASQMIRSITALPGEMIKPPKEKGKEEKVRPGVKEDRSRAKSAVADLLLRQTGALFGSPMEIYEWIGLPREIAQSLTVMGIYRRRSTKLNVDYPFAVRLLPDGRVEARLPLSQGWRPYLEATLYVGKAFNERKNLKFEKGALSEFLHTLLTEPTTVPTLVLAFANDWRTEIWPQLSNDKMLLNELDFTHIDPSLPRYTPIKLPHLRTIRLRDAGNLDETPQYVVTDETVWTKIDEARQIESASGFQDSHTSSPFFHYGSIGRRPLTASRQKRERPKHGPGGGEAFKYQTMVEIVPFFLQPKDDPLTWCRIPHVLRFSPAWDGGNILSPYPIHLAQTAIEDQIAMLGTELSTTLDEEDDGEELPNFHEV